jgi:hypothetical protein
VAVECQTLVLKARLTVQQWWTQERVASEWGVPVADVVALALMWDVPRRLYLPRAAIYRYRDPMRKAKVLYNPDDVCAVAEPIRAARPVTPSPPPALPEMIS